MKLPLKLAGALAVASFAFVPLRGSPVRQADVVIYGATPCGIVTAVRAGREGLKVILVSAYPHIGGSMSNGLGLFDTLYHDRRGPLFDEVRTRITGDPKKFGGYKPHVADAVFEALIAAEKNISLVRGYYPEKAARRERRIETVQFHALDGEDVMGLSRRNLSTPVTKET